MSTGLIGRKIGTGQHFMGSRAVQVTYIEVSPNRIVQLKSNNKEGYSAIQVTTGQRSVFRLTKPEAGHFAKAGVAAGEGLWEFRTVETTNNWVIGQSLTVDQFQSGMRVDVTATSKGKGFAGVIKRWHFSSQDATHGNSLSHRAPGSIGQRTFPGKVFKGKKMAGQLGNKRRTLLSLQVLEVYPKQNLLMVKGSVPGAPGNQVIIRPTIRKRNQPKAVHHAA
jgi:large subunit ribosomal protein L3